MHIGMGPQFASCTCTQECCLPFKYRQVIFLGTGAPPESGGAFREKWEAAVFLPPIAIYCLAK
jgi:hypothetical protein